MNRRLLLYLFSLPTLVGSSFCWLAAMPHQALAATTTHKSDDAEVCVISSHGAKNMVCTRVANVKVDNPKALLDLSKPDSLTLEFSDKESDAAIALFGCDCSACINALRSLQLQAS
ncbi:MAG: hypothetical protein HC860_08340 [Alkalinema sp. RU_4_3]|nr:hypothetical protein [Alkalinema sp. RU_4_3]